MRNQHKHIVLGALFLAALLSGTPSMAEAAETKMDSAAVPTSSGGLIDLNTAGKEMLMTLPGIGEEEALKIIEGRPYHSKTDLRKREIISSGKFYKIIDKITIKLEKKQPPEPAPTSEPEKGKKQERK